MENLTFADIIKIRNDAFFSMQDEIIREVPLLIRVNGFPCAILMRTPGQDRELALGFCFTEGILPDSWKDGALQWEEFDPQESSIGLRLEHMPLFRPARPAVSPSSAFCAFSAASVSSVSSPSTASSCAYDAQNLPAQNLSMEISGDEAEIVNSILPALDRIDCQIQVSLSTLRTIEEHARERQALFALTGATHAALIFDREGNYLFCFEDMARHNALDKAIGYALLAGEDLSDKILFLSGRTNYTLIRKAVRSRIPVVASVSAPTSLAVSLSRKVGMTLIGFLRSEGMNIYAGQERIRIDGDK